MIESTTNPALGVAYVVSILFGSMAIVTVAFLVLSKLIHLSMNLFNERYKSLEDSVLTSKTSFSSLNTNIRDPFKK